VILHLPKCRTCHRPLTPALASGLPKLYKDCKGDQEDRSRARHASNPLFLVGTEALAKDAGGRWTVKKKFTPGFRDDGGAFVLNGEPYFVIMRGQMATIATDSTGRVRTFQSEQLKNAEAVPDKWIALMQGVASMKGAAVGFAPPNLPQWLREWLRGELQELSTLIDGTIDEIDEQVEAAAC
jgi:hypothetical protein